MNVLRASFFIFLLFSTTTYAQDDDVWVWEKREESSERFRGRQLDISSAEVKPEFRSNEDSEEVIFPSENSREVRVSKKISSDDDSTRHRSTSPSVDVELPSTKFQASSSASNEFLSPEKDRTLVSTSGFKPSRDFPPKKTPAKAGSTDSGRIKDQNLTPKANQLQTQPSVSLPTSLPSNLLITPSVQTASAFQNFGTNYPPYPEPFNNFPKKLQDDFATTKSREETIFEIGSSKSSEPAKRSVNATTNENPIRSVAYVVPADISVLPLEEHPHVTQLQSLPNFLQGRFLDSFLTPSSYSSFEGESPTPLPPSDLFFPSDQFINNFNEQKLTPKEFSATTTAPPFIPSHTRFPPRDSLLSPRIPPRESVTINSLVEKLASGTNFGKNQNFIVKPNDPSDDRFNSGSVNNVQDDGIRRKTRKISEETERELGTEQVGNGISTHNSVSSERGKTNDTEHAVYFILNTKLEPPNKPFEYIANNDLKINPNSGVFKAELISKSNYFHPLFDESLLELKKEQAFGSSLGSLSSDFDNFPASNVGKRESKRISIGFEGPSDNGFSFHEDSRPVNSVVNENVFVPPNYYFPSGNTQQAHVATNVPFSSNDHKFALNNNGFNSNFDQSNQNNFFTSSSLLENGSPYQQEFSQLVDGTNQEFQNDFEPPNYSLSGLARLSNQNRYATVSSSSEILVPSQKDNFDQNSDTSIQGETEKYNTPQHSSFTSNQPAYLSYSEPTSTYHNPLRVEIVKPNTLHTITDTIADGKVTTTFYDPLKVTIYKQGSQIPLHVYDSSIDRNRDRTEYPASSNSPTIVKDSQPSFSASVETTNQFNKGPEINEVYSQPKDVVYSQPVETVYSPPEEVSYQEPGNINNRPVEVVYSQPKEDVYSQPEEAIYSKPEVVYSPPKDTVYSQPKEVIYSKPEVVYSQPKDTVYSQPKEVIYSKPEVVYSQPKDTVYSQPKEVIYSKPEVVYSPPKDTVYSQPKEVIYSKPEVVYSPPKDTVYSQPKEVIYSKPEVVYSPPKDTVYSQPKEVIYSKPEVAYSQPKDYVYSQPKEVIYSKPEVVYSQSKEVLSSKPEVDYSQPKDTVYSQSNEVIYSKPEVVNTTPKEVYSQPKDVYSEQEEVVYTQSEDVYSKSKEVNSSPEEVAYPEFEVKKPPGYVEPSNPQYKAEDTGISKAFSILEKDEQDNILSIMQRARGGYPASVWKWPE